MQALSQLSYSPTKAAETYAPRRAMSSAAEFVSQDPHVFNARHFVMNIVSRSTHSRTKPEVRELPIVALTSHHSSHVTGLPAEFTRTKLTGAAEFFPLAR